MAILFQKILNQPDNFLVRRTACHLDLINPNAAFYNLTGIVSDDYGQLLFRNLKAQIVAATRRNIQQGFLAAYALIIELTQLQYQAFLDQFIDDIASRGWCNLSFF